MAQPDSGESPDLAPDLATLQREVRDLALRIANLESRFAPVRSAEPAPLPEPDIESAISGTARVVPAMGMSLLGLAGAYLLRALTESGAVSGRLGVAIGIVYAGAWLFWAARASAGRNAEATLRSLTSALILAPLLWECALRFHAIPNWAVAAILVLFAGFGLAISWHRDLHIVAVIAAVIGLLTSSALVIGTHDVAPFLIAVLVLSVAIEASACFGHWTELRWFSALICDAVILLATYLVARSDGLPEGYAPLPRAVVIAALLALPAIYLVSISVRVLLRHFEITWFEILQAAAALAITVWGVSPRAAGSILIALSILAYLVSFRVLARRTQPRSFYAFSSFAFATAIGGLWLIAPGPAAALVWSAAALVCAILSMNPTLQWHAAAFLLAAAAASGVLRESAETLLAGATGLPARGLAEWSCEIAALVCLFALRRRASVPIALIFATILVWQSAGIAAGLLTGAHHMFWGAAASHDYCATIRTGVLALSAVIMAWIGRFWRREAGWLLYPLMGLGAYRLLVADLHLEQRAALILSLLLYGIAMLILPRISAPRQSTDHPPATS